METLFVYRLVPGADVARFQGVIARALVSAGFQRPDLYVAPESGFLRVGAANGEGATARDAAKARAQAAACLKAFKLALDRERKATGGRMPDVLPLDRLRFIEAVFVVPHDKRTPHWLTRWNLALPTGRGFEEAGVRNAIVDLRLAATPIALVSRLRSWSDVLREPALPAPSVPDSTPHSHEHGNGGAHSSGATTLPIYSLCSENEPQRFVAPFWPTPHQDSHGEAHAHGVPFTPATDKSLAIGIGWEAAGEGVRLSAVANDTHGTLQQLRAQAGWRMRWRSLPIFHGEGGTEGSGEVFELSKPGVHHVSVEVEHAITGAYASTYLEFPVGKHAVPATPPRLLA